MAKRVFVVTGANKGIGFGIVKGLAQQVSDAIIYLTARDETRGKEAVSKLVSTLGEQRKSEIRFHQLDIVDAESAKKLAEHLKNEYGGFDVLVNNAGFAFNNDATEPNDVQARVTIGVNYEGTKLTSEILIPLIRNGGRIVNVCSQAGLLSRYGDEIKKKLSNPAVQISDIDEFCQNYVKACEENNRSEKGFVESAYCASKVAMIALSNVQARDLISRNIVVNACCPGYVDTDMTSHKGPLTIEQGADTPIYLATLEGNEPHGKFIFKRNPIDWTGDAAKWN